MATILINDRIGRCARLATIILFIIGAVRLCLALSLAKCLGESDERSRVFGEKTDRTQNFATILAVDRRLHHIHRVTLTFAE
jgi:hypothetical protein